MPGPVPKRSDQRRRMNKVETPTRKGKAQPFVKQPPAKKGWHADARAWYVSLAESGQSVFYEPSDWRLAQLVAANLSEMLFNGWQASMWKACLDAMDTLLVSEGSRRRARVELHREPVGDAPVKVSSRDRDRKLLEAV